FQSDQTLTSVHIAVPWNATVATFTFWHRYSFDFEASGSTAWDGGVLELSVDNGPWTNAPIITSGGYTRDLVVCPTLNPLANRSAWSGNSGGWVQVTGDLMAYRNHDVRLRFRLGTSETVGGVGWWIDDFSVTFSQQACY